MMCMSSSAKDERMCYFDRGVVRSRDVEMHARRGHGHVRQGTVAEYG